MNEPSIDINRIVREVLSELNASPGTDSGVAQRPETDGSSALPASPETPPANDGSLVISSQVVTMAELDGRLGGVRRLVVPPQAVITPAVRDELLRRNVQLAYASPVADAAPGRTRLAMITAGKFFDPTALIRALQGEGIEVEACTSDCLIAAVDELAGELTGGDALGLLLTLHPAIALCLANRLAGIRAISASEAGTVATTAASVGANLLVVDPTAKNPFQLKQIASEFCRSGPRQCPEVFRKQLG